MWRTDCANAGRIEIMKQIQSHEPLEHQLRRSIEKDRVISTSNQPHSFDQQDVEFFLTTRSSSAGILRQKKNSFR